MELTVNQLLDKIDSKCTIDDLNNDPDLAQARIGLIDLKSQVNGGLIKIKNSESILKKIKKATLHHDNARVAAFQY